MFLMRCFLADTRNLVNAVLVLIRDIFKLLVTMQAAIKITGMTKYVPNSLNSYTWIFIF
jgi:hypothetical protein